MDDDWENRSPSEASGFSGFVRDRTDELRNWDETEMNDQTDNPDFRNLASMVITSYYS